MPPKKAKAAKKEALNPKAVPNREVHQRLSFLYQASTLLNQARGSSARPAKPVPRDADPVASTSAITLEDTAPASTLVEEDKRKRRRQHAAPMERDSVDLIARSMTATMRGVAKKAVVRMDPLVKRTICKTCGTTLQPGVTSKVRVKPSGPHVHVVTHTCLTCSTRRAIPAPSRLTHTERVHSGLRMNGKERRRKRKRIPKEPHHERAEHVTYVHGLDAPRERT